jgi:hypothetical protein
MNISNRENWNIYSLRKSFLDTVMTFSVQREQRRREVGEGRVTYLMA